MSIELTEIVMSIVNFIIFYFIVKIFFFKKIQGIMAERSKVIRDNIDKAIQDREVSEKLLKEAQEASKTSKETGITIINEHKKKAESLYEDIVNDAREEAKLIVLRGTTDANREREQAKKEVRKNVVELATLLSKKVASEDLTEEDHDRLIDEVITKVGEN